MCREIIGTESRGTCSVCREGQNQNLSSVNTTKPRDIIISVATKPVIEKMKVVEKEARKTYRKVKESIQIKGRGDSLNKTDGHDTPDV